MKKLTKAVSVILCVFLAGSVFSVSASAKKTKKYVKLLKVQNNAKITIGEKQKTVTKSYKVTVRIKGKASKKFTAKSSKSSVASVKVSGSKIKVTAKKAGKATITVTTKGKNKNGKKLKAKLNVTVTKKKAKSTNTSSNKNTNKVTENLKSLRDYIVSKGKTNKDGNKYIEYIHKQESVEFATLIVYQKSSNNLKFIESTDEMEMSFTLKFEENKTTKVSFDYNPASSNAYTKSEVILNIASYKKDQNLSFKILKTNVDDYEANNLLSNRMLQLLTVSVYYLILTDLSMHLSDIGFVSYKIQNNT